MHQGDGNGCRGEEKTKKLGGEMTGMWSRDGRGGDGAGMRKGEEKRCPLPWGGMFSGEGGLLKRGGEDGECFNKGTQ